jgi:hypothetical protein
MGARTHPVQHGSNINEVAVRVRQETGPQPMGFCDRLIVPVRQNQYDTKIVEQIADIQKTCEVLVRCGQQNGRGKVMVWSAKRGRQVLQGPADFYLIRKNKGFNNSLQPFSYSIPCRGV